MWQTCFAGDPADSTALSTQKRINILVSCRMKILDGAPLSFQLQAKWHSMFNKKKMRVIIVGSANELVEKLDKIMAKENAMIGNLWFDSHGHMGRRVSSFEIGEDEVNYMTIRENNIRLAIARIGAYCDSNTNIGVGSCYSASTIILPPVDKFPEQRMNGDSLMISVSELMNNATVYGSEAWVMTNPGVFNNGYALAGSPHNNRFRDPIFLPIWKKLGQWKSYSAKTGDFNNVRTLSLDNTGNIIPSYMSFLAIRSNQKNQMRNISRLKEGNFIVKYFYEYEFPSRVNDHHVAKTQQSNNSSSQPTSNN